MVNPMPQLWVLITWEYVRDERGRVTDVLPLTRSYEDGIDAAESYEYAQQTRDAAYLYRTDDSGHMELILETERVPLTAEQIARMKAMDRQRFGRT
jgi:hypothetical protein